MELLEVVEGRLNTFTSAEEQVTYWMANVLRLLLDSDPDCDVDPALGRCAAAHRRAHVIWMANSRLDRVRDETVEALRSVARREAERLLPLLLDDLRAGDESPGEAASPFVYGFVEKAGLLDELSSAVREDIESGRFGPLDVAARLVSFSYLLGGPGTPSGASFDGTMFTKVTGLSAQSTANNERGTWPDTGWTRRQEFAARYIGEPEDAAADAAGADESLD